MKKILAAASSLCLSFAALAPNVRAEDVDAIFKRVDGFVQQKNYAKALEELGWARKEIEKMHMKQLQTFLPDTLSGFKGQTAQSNNVLGITQLERTYKKDGADATVKVSLSGGTGGQAGGLGGLAAFGKMAAMMGGEGQDTFRIGGRTASLEDHSDQKRADLTVFLDSGSILKLEGQNVTGDELKQMAEALKINDLDTYLKGA